MRLNEKENEKTKRPRRHANHRRPSRNIEITGEWGGDILEEGDEEEHEGEVEEEGEEEREWKGEEKGKEKRKEKEKKNGTKRKGKGKAGKGAGKEDNGKRKRVIKAEK